MLKQLEEMAYIFLCFMHQNSGIFSLGILTGLAIKTDVSPASLGAYLWTN